MPASSWLVGSYEGLPGGTITLVHSAVSDNVTFASGDYYVYDATANLSAITTLEAALETHTSSPTYTISVLENRLVQISADAGTFTLDWGDATELRDMLGFTGNLTPAAASFTATNVSDYIWSPGKTESPMMSILGVAGRRVKDTKRGQSSLNGRVTSATNDTRVWNEYIWNHVTPSYFWSTAESGGEWQTFWHTVVSPGLRFKLYRSTTLDTASSSALTWGSVLGPYKYRTNEMDSFDLERADAYLDNNYMVSLPVVVVSEYA